MTKLVVRREALGLLQEALLKGGEFHVTANEYDKVVTYLQLPDQVVQTYNINSPVSVFSFTKLLGKIRRRINNGALTAGATTAAQPSSAAGSVGPNQEPDLFDR